MKGKKTLRIENQFKWALMKALLNLNINDVNISKITFSKDYRNAST